MGGSGLPNSDEVRGSTASSTRILGIYKTQKVVMVGGRAGGLAGEEAGDGIRDG